MEIVPSIDLREGKVVRLKQGDYAQQLNYDVDPVATAQRFKQAGAKWLHIVDLDGAKAGRPVQSQLIEKIIRACGLQVQVGGGVRSTPDIEQLLHAGASRVVVGTKAMEDWDWFAALALEPAMRHKLVLAVDAKDGVIATRGWTHSAGKLAVDIARAVSDWPLAALLYTDVARDGMMTGPNLHHTRLLAEAGKVPVLASGGVGTIAHVRELKLLPVWGVIIGRSLYEGTVDLAEAVREARAVGNPKSETK